MLYITTRSKNDAYTAYRTLGIDRASDGGLFLPMQMPRYTPEQIDALKDRSFGQNLAFALNDLFNGRLDGWDVDFSIGRYPTRLVAMSHRIAFAETWHNPDLDFRRVVRNLSSRLRGADQEIIPPTNWAWIAVRIATLFGIFGQLLQGKVCDGEHPMDVAVPTGDFTAPMAVWYAREMGLPIANIICGCNSNGQTWELLHRGQLRTDGPAEATATARADFLVPPDLERLIYGTLGYGEVHCYLDCMAKGLPYSPPAGMLEDLRRGMYAGVVSDERMRSIIRSVYHTSAYIMDPYTALAYGSLQDYRNRYGISRGALVLCERNPIHEGTLVCAALGIDPRDLPDRLNMR